MLSGSGALIEDGYITLPDGPGLGVELNEALASAHLCEDSTFFA